MKNNIDNLVKEIIEKEPSLNDKQVEVRKIISLMLENKPDWEPDQNFVRQLRVKIYNQKSHSIYKLFNMDKIKTLSFGGAAIVTVAVLISIIYNNPMINHSLSNKSLSNLGIDTRFVSADINAFGSLSGLDIPTANDSLSPQAVGLGGGGGGGIMSDEMAKLIAPYEITKTTYKYIGDEIQLPGADDLPVYQYQFNSEDAKNLADIIKNTPINLATLKNFNSLLAENIQLKEDKSRGYMINLNFSTGQVNINLNFPSWPEFQCYENCEYKPMSPSQIPEDNVVFQMAEKFLDDHGVDKSIYGEPIIDDRWKKYQGEDITYVPTVITVVYPLRLPQGEVHDVSGYPYGLSVGVNIEHNIIDSVYNIYGGKYYASKYELETNTDRILRFVEDGGRPSYPWYIDNQQIIKEVTYELGTPDQIYIQHYPPEKLVRSMLPRVAGDLYIPALRFPVLNQQDNKDDNMYKPDYVIIPLVTEILDSYEIDGRQTILPIEPVPLPAVLEETPADETTIEKPLLEISAESMIKSEN